jgi:hypothetical protein
MDRHPLPPGPPPPPPLDGHGSEEIIVCVIALIVVAVAVYLIARIVEGRTPFARRERAPSDPLEVIRVRYARGELGREEYLEAWLDLTSGTPPVSPRPPAPPAE